MSNTKFVSQKYNNYQYAPGIALYGVDGKAGVSGTNGTSLFICVYDIQNDEDRGKFGNAIRHGNTMTTEEPKSIGRNYTVGDSFLFPDGKIYSIKKGSDDNVNQYLNILISSGDNLTPDEFDECMEYVGRIRIENQNDRFQSQSNRLVLDTDEYKGFVINNSDSDDIGNIEAPLTIIGSTKTGTNGIERYLDIKSIQTGMSDAQFRIYYDENNSTYVIDSDRPIRIDADLSVKNSSSSSATIAGYSGISVTETPITAFKCLCEQTEFKEIELEKDVIYEYHPDANNVTSQIYDRQIDENKDFKYGFRIGNELYQNGEDGIKYLMYDTMIHYGGSDFRKASKLSVHVFMDDKKVIGKPIFLQFINTDSEGNKQLVDINEIVIMNTNGERNEEKVDEVEGIPGRRRYWITKTDSNNVIYVPSESDGFVIVMPSELNAHIMVFAQDLPGHSIDSSKEEENFKKLEELFEDSGHPDDRFPINVLQTSTSHYYRSFDIKFAPKQGQIVSTEVLPQVVHIKGILNGCVAVEFYKKIDVTGGEGGFDITVDIDSYKDIKTISDWMISLIGISEIEIKKNKRL